MFKKIASLLLSLFLIFPLVNSVNAEETNLLSDYANLDWKGDTLYLDKESNAIFFKRKESQASQRAEVYFDIEQGSSGFLFYIDMGNGNSNGDSGYCNIRFFNDDGTEIFTSGTGFVSNFKNYARFFIGEDEAFYPLPDKAKKVKIELNVTQSGSTKENVQVYFRNLSLFFSKDMPLCKAEDMPLMKKSDSLSKVEIGVTPYIHLIWIGFIFLIAMSFYLIRVWRQKYSTPKLNGKK